MKQDPVADLDVTGRQQRAAWQRRDAPPVERLRTDLWSIPVPMPDNPLRYVLVYALAGDSGLTLVDAGWDDDVAWAALVDGLETFGATPEDVRGVLVTHMHVDHVGLARRLHETSGAWVALHPADAAGLADPEYRIQERAATADRRWFMSLGASSDQANALIAAMGPHDTRSSQALADRLVEHKQSIQLPGWTVTAIHTPGHTPGHLCFYDEESRVMFGGDHLLPRITPNVSAYRDPGGDALGDFLQSLDDVSQLDVTEVLPAHEWRYRKAAVRAEQLKRHHEARLSEVLEAVRRHGSTVPWELAAELTWSRPWESYDGLLQIAAIGETAAHLGHLRRRGLVSATAGSTPRYSTL